MSTSQRNFNSGELSPALYARTDQAKYAAGLRTCRNLLVMRQGGVTSRPGTEYIGTLTTAARLLPFEFNDSQTYVLVFTNQAVRFVRDGAYILSSGSPYTVSTPYLTAELADLQIAQSGDVVTIVHPSHPPQNLSRIADDSWTLTAVFLSPIIDPPTIQTFYSQAGTAVVPHRWIVTAVNADGIESFASVASPSDPHATLGITWTDVTGAVSYNIYKATDTGGSVSDYGFIGSSAQPNFWDDNFQPDSTARAPVVRNPFASVGNYPAAVSYYQQRRLFANTTNNPNTIWTSRSADYGNFTVSSPIQDDDAVTFALVGKKVQSVVHLLDADGLLAFTNGGQWSIEGDQAHVLRPTEINARQYAPRGTSALVPIIIDKRIVFVQARRSVVRDVSNEPIYGFRGNDLTTFANHLFDGYTLVDWAFAEVPHSLVWVVRSDGTLLSLTYLNEQQILGWSRHDTDGTVENVCVVPEGGEDRVYLVVNRSGGRFLERMRSLFWTDIAADAAFVDAMLSYDGRNTDTTKTLTLTGGTSLTLTGGTDWLPGETLTLTASAAFFASPDVGTELVVTDGSGNSYTLVIGVFTSSLVVTGTPTATVPVAMRGVAVPQWRYDQQLTLTASAAEFVSGDVGNQFFLYDATGAVVRFTISAYTSATVVQGFPVRTVLATLAGVPTAVWSRAVDQVSGLGHLEGQDVSIFADGFVVSSPNNPSVATIAVTGGIATLDKPYAVIFVGLPYVSDFETLDIDTPEGPSLKVSKMLINQVVLMVDRTRGLWIGPGDPEPTVDLVGTGSGLKEAKIRDAEDYDAPVDLLSGPLEVNVETGYNRTGRLFVRQVDPVPMTILAAMPSGFIPGAK